MRAILCDHCRKEIPNVQDRYQIDRIILKTPEFTDEAGDTGHYVITSELCYLCAYDVVSHIKYLSQHKSS